MMGELSGSGVSSRRTNRIAILRSAGRRRGAVPGLHRRLRSATDVPSTGQIVFRDGRSIVL